MTKRRVAKTKKAKPVEKIHHTAKPAPKPEPKPEPKAEPWQPIDSAPVMTPVYVRLEGKTIEAILDGHWYACIGGKADVNHIIYNPSGWMPLKS